MAGNGHTTSHRVSAAVQDLVDSLVREASLARDRARRHSLSVSFANGLLEVRSRLVRSLLGLSNVHGENRSCSSHHARASRSVLAAKLEMPRRQEEKAVICDACYHQFMDWAEARGLAR